MVKNHIEIGLLVLLPLLSACSPPPIKTTTNLYTLTDQNFREFVNSKELVFVKFHVDWCSHCESLKKPFEELARTYEGKITFAQVNGDDNPKTLRNLHLQGYPNLLLFIKGSENHLQYFGPVDEKEHIKSFLDSVFKKELKDYNDQDLEVIKNEEPYYGFGVFCGAVDTPAYANLKLAYQLTDNIHIYIATDKETCDKFSLAPNQLTYKRKSGTVDRFSQFDDFQKLRLFLKFVRFDFVNRFTQDLIGEAIGSRIPILVYVDPHNNSRNLGLLEELHTSIKYNFIVLHNRLEESFEREYIELFGSDNFSEPSLYIAIIGRELQKFKFNDTWTKANIAKFILKFIQQEIKPTVKSEEAPKDETGPVYTITANTMAEYLQQPDYGKVLLFYYTGCNHCKEAVEMFEVAAKNQSDKLNLKFGKINVAKNELPNISNIPAIAYFPKGNEGKPDYFEGTLDPKELEAFLQKKVSENEVSSEL